MTQSAGVVVFEGLRGPFADGPVRMDGYYIGRQLLAPGNVTGA